MKFVGITACPAGVAHTYMAAKALIKEAEQRGHEMIIEKQGSLGIEDELSRKEIRSADAVVFAVAVAVEDPDRFDGKPIYEVKIGKALKHPKDVIDALEQLAGEV